MKITKTIWALLAVVIICAILILMASDVATFDYLSVLTLIANAAIGAMVGIGIYRKYK